MKGFILVSLTTMVLSSAVVSSVKADPNSLNAYIPNATPTVTLTPFDLVSAAKQGKFTYQGIPGHAAFTTEYIQGKLTAEDLVEAAIQNNDLKAETINDPAYLNNVREQLRGINRLF